MNKKAKMLSGGLILGAFTLWAAYAFLDNEKLTLDDQERANLEGSFVELPGGVVHYELEGPVDGPGVVLIHGFSVPYYVWDPTFKALVDAGFRVLRYDLYGRGYSDRPEVEYNLVLYVTQLRNLLSALDIDPPSHIVGLSYGGPIAAAYASLHPEVSTLILIDPLTAPVSSSDIFPMNLPLIGEYASGVYLVPLYLPKSQVEDFFRPENFPEWKSKYRPQTRYRGFKRAILSSIRDTVNIDALKIYDSVAARGIPVLLVWGAQDQTISSADMDLLRSTIPMAEFHTISDAGHLPHYERPDVVNPILIDFLTRSQP